MEQIIEHEDEASKGAFFVQKDGQRVAEMTYSLSQSNTPWRPFDDRKGSTEAKPKISTS